MNLFDANILVYSLDADSPQHTPSRAAIEAAASGRLPGVLVPQVLLEFFSVVTNPRRMQHPMPTADAWAEVTRFRTALPVLDVPAHVLTLVDDLVVDRRPRGGAIYDLFLVAQMRAHGVVTLCTYDAGFSGIPGIDAVAPEALLTRLRLS